MESEPGLKKRNKFLKYRRNIGKFPKESGVKESLKAEARTSVAE